MSKKGSDHMDDSQEEYTIQVTNKPKQDIEEKIFTTLCTRDLYIDNENCVVDNVEFSLLVSKRHCCFCGYLVCHNCSQKKRENPQKKGEFARICDLCDERYLRKKIMQQDKEKQSALEQEIQGYERALKELNQDYKQILQERQEHESAASENTQQLKDELEEKESKIEKLTKQIKKIDKKIESVKLDQQDTESKINDVKEDIKIAEQEVNNLKKQDEEKKEKIQEYDQKIQELNQWLAKTNKDVSNWAITNKKFESFKHRNGASSIWQQAEGNTLNYNDNEIFRYMYEDSDEESENQTLNSHQIGQLTAD